MTNVPPVLRMALLCWLAACPFAGCDDVTSPGRGRATDLFDKRSPFAGPAQGRVPTCSETDRTAAVAVWTKLRNDDYPYHLQTVALSPPFPGGCRALIITEPPPTVSLAELRALAPRLLASAETRQHEIGYDGWTRDVVVPLPPVKDAELTELIAGLHTAMFDTTYRMATLDTSQPVPAYDPASAPLDLGIAPGELHRWLLEDAVQFTPLGGGDPASFKDLLASDEPEVYLDDADGLIVWIVPRRSDIAEMAALFRQFAVESDVIIGAMASNTALAIIARQRAVDPLILQPLRFEVVSLLAAVHDRPGLQQSYDRTHPLAGRIDDSHDWAPIFLSPELVDTEYGSVLDIADQLLKSWSNNGKTQYAHFQYPAPAAWAFPEPVFMVANAHRFRYNWNTASVGAVVNVDDVDVFWLRRTGALNVSYFPDEDELADHPATKQPRVQNLEQTAYQFFTQTQTPILARVVQYNALFQIFARFGVTSSANIPAASRAAAAQTLAAAARGALVAIRDAGDGEIKRRLARSTGGTPTEARDRGIADVKALARQLAKLDDNGLDELGHLVGDPRTGTRRKDLFELSRQVRALGPLFRPFAKTEIYKAYAESAVVKSDAWIHTPAVVISWNEPPIEAATGGHDLHARVAAVKFHSGTPEIAADQIARRHPVDAVGAKELGRLELGPSGPTLARAPANRAARPALGGIGQGGFWRKPARRMKPGGRFQEASVTRLSDGYRVLDAAGAVHEVTTMPEVVELIRNGRGIKGGHVTIHFDGMQLDEVRRTVRAAEIHTQAEIAGVVKPLPEFAKQKLDFATAELRETETRTYHDGAGEIGHVITVPGARPLSIEVKVAVRRGTPGVLRALGAKIRELIRSVIRRLSGTRVSAYDLGRALRTELRQLLRDELPPLLGHGVDEDQLRDLIRLELKMRQEATDVLIVQRKRPVSHGTRDLA